MIPAFGLVEAKGLLPCFMDAVNKARKLCLRPSLKADSGPFHQMTDKWGDIIENGKSGDSAIIDVNMWMGWATLDACVLASACMAHGLTVNLSLERIGAGAFDYDFGALDDVDNPLTKSYMDLVYDNLPPPPAVQGSRRADPSAVC